MSVVDPEGKKVVVRSGVRGYPVLRAYMRLAGSPYERKVRAKDLAAFGAVYVLGLSIQDVARAFGLTRPHLSQRLQTISAELQEMADRLGVQVPMDPRKNDAA
ncbi:MAG: hypothetical protein AB7G12_12650 [Thermoanaerobaculia bacterium]